jgi:lactate dehydrogenase-like 2-hydroxyacid dehydrogenase
MVNAAVLEALGPTGYLVNVARGSVIDTPALIEALENRRIAGAAFDVFENEPGVPRELWSLPNIVLTPHLAGAAPEVRRAQIELALQNLKAFFAGEPLVNLLA